MELVQIKPYSRKHFNLVFKLIAEAKHLETLPVPRNHSDALHLVNDVSQIRNKELFTDYSIIEKVFK